MGRVGAGTGNTEAALEMDILEKSGKTNGKPGRRERGSAVTVKLQPSVPGTSTSLVRGEENLPLSPALAFQGAFRSGSAAQPGPPLPPGTLRMCLGLWLSAGI